MVIISHIQQQSLHALTNPSFLTIPLKTTILAPSEIEQLTLNAPMKSKRSLNPIVPYQSPTTLLLSAAADLVYIRHPGHSPYQTSSFPHQSAHSVTVAGSRGDGGGRRKREEQRQSQGRERCVCCNVMLNSNMQCSHHGNGGSSEALHGAENVCLLACVCQCICVSMLFSHLYKGAARYAELVLSEEQRKGRGCSAQLRDVKKNK